MRYALSGSVLVHACLFLTALLGFAWPQPDDAPAPGAVTVDIVTMETVSTNTTASQESMTAQNLISAGAEAVLSRTVAPVEPETIAPLKPPETVLTPPNMQPLMPQPVSAIPAEPSQTVLATSVAALEPAPVAPLAPLTPDETTNEAAVRAPTPVIEPVSVSDAKMAPVPQTLSFTRPSTPTARAEARRQPAAPPPAQAAGNGGANNADAAAGKAAAGEARGTGGGGTADIAPWERQVRRKLANAQRYPRAANGAAGDVVVGFTVSASGSLSGLSILASSGNAVLDQAALDTVGRAAPFPPIPVGAGLASKAVAIPLGFVR